MQSHLFPVESTGEYSGLYQVVSVDSKGNVHRFPRRYRYSAAVDESLSFALEAENHGLRVYVLLALPVGELEAESPSVYL